MGHHKTTVESGKNVGTSNTDGALVLKGFNSDGDWQQRDVLTYCSIEVSVSSILLFLKS